MKFFARHLFLTSLLVVLPYGGCSAQNLLSNPSFESNLSSWSKNSSYTITARTSWNGVTPQDGSKFVSISGPIDPGTGYIDLLWQTKSPPYGNYSDNCTLYLYAYTYIHTNDGRAVDFAVLLEPGYGEINSALHSADQNKWVLNQVTGYYYAYDPNDSGSTQKSAKVYIQLRDPLLSGEYICIDNVQLYVGQGGAEP